MDLEGINSFFGDIDLFLMDLILKGKVPHGKVLDVGCGDGRNGIYFIRNGYEYHGWDLNESKISMLAYLAKSLDSSQAHFKTVDLLDARSTVKFDFIVCSRVLHFSKSQKHFDEQWHKLRQLVDQGGIIYVSMDSAIDNTLAQSLGDGQFEFPDTKIRFALTEALYEEMKKGFEEVEPLRTLAHHNERAQSFLILRKV